MAKVPDVPEQKWIFLKSWEHENGKSDTFGVFKSSFLAYKLLLQESDSSHLPYAYEQQGGNQLFQQCSHFPLVLVSLLCVHAGWEPFVAGLRAAVEMKLMNFSIAPLSRTIQSTCAASGHNTSPFLTWVFQFLCSNWELLPDAHSENYGCTCVYVDSIYFGNAKTCVDRALRFVVFIFPFLFCVFLKISINSLLDHLEKNEKPDEK